MATPRLSLCTNRHTPLHFRLLRPERENVHTSHVKVVFILHIPPTVYTLTQFNGMTFLPGNSYTYKNKLPRMLAGTKRGRNVMAKLRLER